MGKYVKIENSTRFGKLVVLDMIKKGRYEYFKCLCDCGKTHTVRKSSLVSGDTRSCGCLRKELPNRSITHGKSSHRLYQTWLGMHRRCSNEKSKDFKHYGGRGIRVSPEWTGQEGLIRFLCDMEPTYIEGLELDRIDVNGDYCKDNCRWATRREQVINRRPMNNGFDAKPITYKGKTLCLSEWAEELGMSRGILSDRITTLGWDIEKAFTTKIKIRECLIIINGEEFKINRDVFKSYPNIFVLCNKIGVTVQDFLYFIFKDIGFLKVFVNKTWSVYEPTTELNFDLKDIKLPIIRDEFPYKDYLLSITRDRGN